MRENGKRVNNKDQQRLQLLEGKDSENDARWQYRTNVCSADGEVRA